MGKAQDRKLQQGEDSSNEAVTLFMINPGSQKVSIAKFLRSVYQGLVRQRRHVVEDSGTYGGLDMFGI